MGCAEWTRTAFSSAPDGSKLLLEDEEVEV